MLILALIAMVAGILAAQKPPALQPLFRWLPVPLWCYALPMLAVTVGLLPCGDPAYGALAGGLLPLALACLLLGVNLPAVAASGMAALSAAAIGAAGILLGAPLSTWLLRAWLPADAWKGAGALAATWTGGTMNLLAMRSVLTIPEPVFTPLIIVDAAVAYGWMALLVAASPRQQAMDRWLGASALSVDPIEGPSDATVGRAVDVLVTVACAGLLTLLAGMLAARLPTSAFVSSATGWRVLLVTTGALACSLIPPLRRAGSRGAAAGYPLLYAVLAATGAQADLRALWSAPAWLLAGMLTVLLHGALLLAAGRWLRLPFGLLATASQANIGGVVSAPLVGAVYRDSLAPVGLLLAMAGNALGTYLGLFAASLARRLFL